MSGFGLVYAMPRKTRLRGWQWATAVAGVLTLLVAMSPVSHSASATMIQSTGRVEHMIVRAIPGHPLLRGSAVVSDGGQAAIERRRAGMRSAGPRRTAGTQAWPSWALAESRPGTAGSRRSPNSSRCASSTVASP